MTEATDLHTGDRYRILHFATDKTKSKYGLKMVVYAHENRLDEVFTMLLSEFVRLFDIN